MIFRKFHSKLVKGQDFAYGISKVVIFSHFHHKGKCTACNGLGKKGTVQCKTCEGKGTREYSHAEKVMYGFPMRQDLSRKWYQQSCLHYDQYIQAILWDIEEDLIRALQRIKKQALSEHREDKVDFLLDF